MHLNMITKQSDEVLDIWCSLVPGVCNDKCKGEGRIDVPILGCINIGSGS